VSFSHNAAPNIGQKLSSNQDPTCVYSQSAATFIWMLTR